MKVQIFPESLQPYENNTSMKTVFYRIQPTDASEVEGFIYRRFRVNSDVKVTEELCIKNEFGINYLNKIYNPSNPDIICEILSIEEDDV